MSYSPKDEKTSATGRRFQVDTSAGAKVLRGGSLGWCLRNMQEAGGAERTAAWVGAVERSQIMQGLCSTARHLGFLSAL